MTKKPAPRVLKKSGEKVITLPDGNRQIIPSGGLAATLAATEGADRREDAELTQARLSAIEVKRESLSAGDAVPDDKRVV